MQTNDKDDNALLLSEKASLVHRNSLPDIKFIKNLAKCIETCDEEKQPIVEVVESVDAKNQTDERDEDEEFAGQCAVSGRLEIRVIPKGKLNGKLIKVSGFSHRFILLFPDKTSNPDESEYYDAITNGGATVNIKTSTYDVKMYEDSLKIQRYKVVEPEEVVASEKELGAISKIKSADVENEACNKEVEEISKESTEINSDENKAKAFRIGNHSPNARDNVNSKIPVFAPNLRIAKCASWAGDYHDRASEILPELSDLTPGLRRRRQQAEKYVTDPSQLNLRFTRPKPRVPIK
jgi:tau tubulin kinase